MSKKTVRIGIGAFLLIIGSLFYLMNMYTPICGDDYLYSFYLTPVAAKSFFEGTSIGFEQKISLFLCEWPYHSSYSGAVVCRTLGGELF